jgi:hypothetical protein
MWGEPIVGVLARISFPQFALALSIYFFFLLLKPVEKSGFWRPPKKNRTGLVAEGKAAPMNTWWMAMRSLNTCCSFVSHDMKLVYW